MAASELVRSSVQSRSDGKRLAEHLVVSFGHTVRARTSEQLCFDSRTAVNGHMLVAGPSGTGKTHQLNRITRTLAQQGAKQIFVINVHGDLCEGFPSDLVHRVAFSETSAFGLSPLDVLSDTEIGGVRRRANSFINLLARQGALGPKQKTALYRLLVDLYSQFGFFADDPSSWSLDHDPRKPRTAPAAVAREGYHLLPGLDWFALSETERTELKREFGLTFNGGASKWEVPLDHPRASEAIDRWGTGGKRHPTLQDLKRHLYQRLVAVKTGQSTFAVRALDKVMTLATKRARLRTRKLKAADQEELDKVEGQLSKAREEALDAYMQGMERLDSGKELDELILWDGADAIRGLFDRVEALDRAGIFRGKPPPFDDKVPIWNYDIKSLSDEEKQLFVDTLLERIFIEAKSRGEATGPDTFIVIDEAHLFVSPEGDHIINRLVKEARKYGIGLILASQAFVHFSDDLLMSAGTKLVLGCPEMYREPMRRKLGLDMIEYNGKRYNPLRFLKPQETALVSVSIKGEAKPMVEVRIAA